MPQRDPAAAWVRPVAGMYMRIQPVRAIQWWRAGDHHDVRPCKSTLQCPRCAAPMLSHGEIFAGNRVRYVCPGDWIVEDFDAHHIVRADEFDRMFAPAEV